jgi:hypothetical protein
MLAPHFGPRKRIISSLVKYFISYLLMVAGILSLRNMPMVEGILQIPPKPPAAARLVSQLLLFSLKGLIVPSQRTHRTLILAQGKDTSNLMTI